MIVLATASGEFPVSASVSMARRRHLSAYQKFIDPLAAPAEADLIDLVAFCGKGAIWPRVMKHGRRPAVALVGDDPGGLEGWGGPDAWALTLKLSRWARAVIVHAAGGEPQHYAEAVRAALKVGRVALVETTSFHARAWAERLNCPRILLILPHGGVHPCVAEVA